MLYLILYFGHDLGNMLGIYEPALKTMKADGLQSANVISCIQSLPFLVFHTDFFRNVQDMNVQASTWIFRIVLLTRKTQFVFFGSPCPLLPSLC